MGGFSTLGLSWEQIKQKLESEGAKNKAYDSDVDGVFDIGAIPSQAKRHLIAFDESEVSTTSTSATSVKQFNLVKLSTIKHNWTKLIVIAEGYIDTSGETANLDIVIGGTKYDTISWTETDYTIKTSEIDISSLADGKHLVDFQLYVTGGTGYQRLLEVWVE